MSLQAYVGTFTIPTAGTLGSQTVTGIVDTDGAAFTPKAIVIWGQVTTKGAINPGAEEWNSLGFSDGTHNVSATINSRWFAGIPWRGSSTSVSYAITQLISVFTAAYHLTGAVTGFGSGSFTYRLDANVDGGSATFNVFNFLALGGSDLTAVVGVASKPGGGTGHGATTGLGFRPTGGLFFQNHGGSFNDGVGVQLDLGWCDTALNQTAMCSSLAETFNPSNASGALLSGAANIINNNDAGTVTPTMSVVSWDADGFTLDYLTGGTYAYLALGGPTTYAGTVTEPVSDSSVTITPSVRVTPTCILFGSVGQPTSTSLQQDETFSLGAYDGTHERAFWNGSLYGSDGSSGGGQNWGTTASLVLAQGNGVPSASLIETGTLHGTALTVIGFQGAWTQTDGVAREVMYFTFGTETPVPVVTTYPIRRLRRFMLPWDDQNRMKFLSRMEIILQAGIGTADVSNPAVMLRLSKDGGKTWGHELQMQAGELGAYSTRVYANRLGRGRNWVAEVTVSDPVAWEMISCLIDYEEGSS